MQIAELGTLPNSTFDTCPNTRPTDIMKWTSAPGSASSPLEAPARISAPQWILGRGGFLGSAARPVSEHAEIEQRESPNSLSGMSRQRARTSPAIHTSAHSRALWQR